MTDFLEAFEDLTHVEDDERERKVITFFHNLPGFHGNFILETIGTLRSKDADGNENVKKTIAFISTTITLHVTPRHFNTPILYISLPVFARLRREHA